MLLLDEFANLGRLDDISKALGLEPTVVSPAAKSILGRFSSRSRQGKGQTFKRLLSKVMAPSLGHPRGFGPRSSAQLSGQNVKSAAVRVSSAPKSRASGACHQMAAGDTNVLSGLGLIDAPKIACCKDGS